MSEALRTCGQQTLWDIPSATSSPAEGSGASPCDGPDGRTTGRCGLEAAPAPVSARQEKAEGLQTLVTSGLIGRDSLRSAALQQSLESRLLRRLDTAGSTLFNLTWRRKTTPLGRVYLERAVLGHRTLGKDSTSSQSAWPSPKASDDNSSRYSDPQRGSAVHYARPNHSTDLAHLAQHLASWPTPMAGSPATEEYSEAGNTDASRKTGRVLQTNLATDAKMLAGWPTPNTMDTVERMEMRPSREATGRTVGYLSEAVVSYGEPMPTRIRSSGEIVTGFSAEMVSGGQLRPEHSRWLMGVPPEWDGFVCTATRSVSRRRRSSSGRTGK